MGCDDLPFGWDAQREMMLGGDGANERDDERPTVEEYHTLHDHALAKEAEVADLRAELADERAAHAKTCSNFDEMAEAWSGQRRQLVAEAERLTTERDEYQQIFDFQWKRMHAAGDLWRQEDPISRDGVWPDLGVLLDWLMARISEERERANEAARLSAEARDRADDLAKTIEDLREARREAEDERDAMRGWADNVCLQHGIGDHGDSFVAIGRHLDKLQQAMEADDLWKVAADAWVEQRQQLVAERDAMRAVVEAARVTVALWESHPDELTPTWSHAQQAAAAALSQISGEGETVRTPSPAEPHEEVASDD